MNTWASFVPPAHDTRLDGSPTHAIEPEDAEFAPPNPDDPEKVNMHEGVDPPDEDRDGCTLIVEGVDEKVKPQDIAKRFQSFASLRELPAWDGMCYRVVFARRGDLQMAQNEVSDGAMIGGIRAQFRALKA